MAYLQKLREEISFLQGLFPKTHKTFQVISATLDEVSVKFLDSNGRSFRLYASIQDDYPDSPPIWYCECDDSMISSVLEQVATSNSSSIVHHIHNLVFKLCRLNNTSVPAEIYQLAMVYPMVDAGGDVCNDGPDVISGEESNGDEEFIIGESLDINSQDGHSPHEEREDEVKQYLSRVATLQHHRQAEGIRVGSVAATDRLMKELKDIYRSENFKNGVFAVEITDDNIYEWSVMLKKVDGDSKLASDLKKFEKNTGQDHILFHFIFNESFPFEPPFVHLISPQMDGGHVINGALCMEVLTKQGWSSAYSVESLIMQIAATLVKGKAGINLGAKDPYSLSKAQQSFRSILSIHGRFGWYTPPKSKG